MVVERMDIFAGFSKRTEFNVFSVFIDNLNPFNCSGLSCYAIKGNSMLYNEMEIYRDIKIN